jgi:pyridoxine 5-phosphate synthase
MTDLSVNLNKIALLRNSRDTGSPCVSEHAKICLAAGADGITVHPRPDQRHIRIDDVRTLSELLNKDYPGVEFNIEGNPFSPAQASNRQDVSDYPGFMELIREIKPAQCTLVPDGDDQLTSDHGFDMNKDAERLAPIIAELKTLGCRVSLFMDPIEEQITLAKQAGADRIEFYTGPYAQAWNQQNDAQDKQHAETVYQRYHDAAKHALNIGIGLNAGHDLDLNNLPKFANIPGLLEVSIGHELTVDAIQVGMSEAVKRYKACLK